jgi:hypothetical protein
MTSAARHADALPLSLELSFPNNPSAPLLQSHSRGEVLPASGPPQSYPTLRAHPDASASDPVVHCPEAPTIFSPLSFFPFSCSGSGSRLVGRGPDLFSCVTAAASWSQLPVVITSMPLQKLREMRDGGVRARASCSKYRCDPPWAIARPFFSCG